MKMAPVISVLCFVSRIRLQDREPANGIHLGLQMFAVLHRFFGYAALCGKVGNQHHPRTHWVDGRMCRPSAERRI